MKTHIFCIIDRSGSMGGLETATIDGYNEFVGTLQEEETAKDSDLTLVLFDDQYEEVFDKKPLKQVPLLNRETYFVRGGTALVDAVCRTLRGRKISKQDRSLVLIITDGMENSSREYKQADMKKLVDAMQERGTTFTFLGANMDAWNAAEKYGFSASNVATYTASAKGTGTAFASMASNTANYMRTASVGASSLDFYSADADVLKAGGDIGDLTSSPVTTTTGTDPDILANSFSIKPKPNEQPKKPVS